MTNENNILSFEQRLEKRNFVFDDELLKALYDRKLKRMQEQSKQTKELKSLYKRNFK
jgi:hypothetical protein